MVMTKQKILTELFAMMDKVNNVDIALDSGLDIKYIQRLKDNYNANPTLKDVEAIMQACQHHINNQ